MLLKSNHRLRGLQFEGMANTSTICSILYFVVIEFQFKTFGHLFEAKASVAAHNELKVKGNKLRGKR